MIPSEPDEARSGAPFGKPANFRVDRTPLEDPQLDDIPGLELVAGIEAASAIGQLGNGNIGIVLYA